MTIAQDQLNDRYDLLSGKAVTLDAHKMMVGANMTYGCVSVADFLQNPMAKCTDCHMPCDTIAKDSLRHDLLSKVITVDAHRMIAGAKGTYGCVSIADFLQSPMAECKGCHGTCDTIAQDPLRHDFLYRQDHHGCTPEDCGSKEDLWLCEYSRHPMAKRTDCHMPCGTIAQDPLRCDLLCRQDHQGGCTQDNCGSKEDLRLREHGRLPGGADQEAGA